MADPRKRLSENCPGELFVDSTCIDCLTCLQVAPDLFAHGQEVCYVARQPRTQDDWRQACHAIVCCPTGAIGGVAPARRGLLGEAMGDFPIPIADEVHFCGFHSPESYGAHSYFILHPEGNWLVDSPRFHPKLVRRFEELGGLRRIFLTHRDDAAQAGRFAEHFGAERIIHEADADAQPEAERKLSGRDPIELGAGFLAIPTPGHTRGHCVLLYRDTFLFAGDHLFGRYPDQRLGMSRGTCWHSWPEQIASLERLRAFSFSWVLPGHWLRVHRPEGELRSEIAQLAERLTQLG